MNKREFLVGLGNIEQSMNSNTPEGEICAVKEFKKSIEEVAGIGGYSCSNWDSSLRTRVYKFGEIFKEKDPCKFIEILEESQGLQERDSEFLEFIKSEIVWNYFDQKSIFTSNVFRDLIEKYPYNPEFHHSYSHYLENIGEYELSISEARLALKMDNQNQTFFDTCFNKEKHYFNLLLKDKKIDQAENIGKEMLSLIEDDRQRHFVYNNIIVALLDRIEDHRIIDKRIGEINDIIFREMEKERKRLIEVLSIFVGILGFIFINTNILLNNLHGRDILSLMIAMADILIIFAITISYLFASKESNDFWSFLRHRKFWIIACLFILLFVIWATS